MVIGFETPELRSLCEDEAVAIAAYGADASPLKAALADLDAAPSLPDLPPGTIQVRGEGWIAMECPPIVLLFVPNHQRHQLDDKGQINQGKVTRVKVMGIERRA